MIRVAAYCRVSTEKEDQANSFESQKYYFREWIDRNPEWSLEGIYADEGISGTNTKRRIQFNRMIREALEGRIDLIITKEVSRFARNTVDTLEYTRELRKRGIGVIFLTDNINTLDADGELRLAIMSSIAQNESRLTSDRVKWGQRRSMERGVVFGGSLLGYDVIAGKMMINPEGAKTVTEIFRRYLIERKGSGTIARELNDEGIASSRGYIRWTSSTVLKILKNEKYCGDLIQQKTYTPDYLSHEKKYNTGQLARVVIRDHHEPIIDRETWDAVQREIIRRNSGNKLRGRHGNRYPLSGKLICGECGSGYVSRTKKSRTGDPYRVWRCGKATAEGRAHSDTNGNLIGCDVGRQIRDDIAMDVLKRTVDAVVMDRETMAEDIICIVGRVLGGGRGDPGKYKLERELETVTKKKRRAMEEFLDHNITGSEMRFLSELCDQKMEHIRKQIEDIETGRGISNDITNTEMIIKSIVNGEREADYLYGGLLDQMTLHGDGKIEVSLKFLSARWYYATDGIGK